MSISVFCPGFYIYFKSAPMFIFLYVPLIILFTVGYSIFVPFELYKQFVAGSERSLRGFALSEE